MNAEMYIAEVLRTYAGKETREDKLILGSLGLAGESGEVIDMIKKHLYAGHDLNGDALLKEIGDVLWYLALMCSTFGWTLDDAIRVNVDKLHKRFPDGFSSERSIRREEGDMITLEINENTPSLDLIDL